jgi:hypothetical protein
MSGFCSEPDSANSFSMIFWVSTNHVWSWPLCMTWASVPRVSKPGNSGGGSRRPVASSHSDDGPGMIRIPWRVPIGSQLCTPSVWCHMRSSLITRPPAACAITSIRPPTWSGTPEIICVGGVPSRSGQLARTSFVVAADAAGGDEHDRRRQRELPDRRARALLPAPRGARLEPLSAHAGHRAAAQRQRVDLVAEAQLDRPPRLRRAHAPDERLEHAGAGAHVMWMRGTELPCPVAR